MSLLDINNIDALTPEQRAQFEGLLAQYPHLDSRLKDSRELNTPTKLASDELDYSSFLPPQEPTTAPSQQEKSNVPTINIDPKSKFLQQMGVEEHPEHEEIPPASEKTFSPIGKIHPILQKMRMALGLPLSPTEFPKIEIAGCQYAMHQIDRVSIVNALSLTSASSASNPALYDGNLEVAILAYAIREIDRVPVEVIFDSPEKTLEGRTLSQDERHAHAADLLFLELQHSKGGLIDALSTFYQQEFPELSLLGNSLAKFICPVANCLKTRLDDVGAVCYCTAHGVQMVKEGDLPNPS